MASRQHPLLLLLLCAFSSSLFVSSSAQTACADISFGNNSTYVDCKDLPTLGSSIHWTYDSNSDTIDFAYRASTTSQGWVSWGINPTGSSVMEGTQALLAYINSTSGGVMAHTTPIESKQPTLQPGNLSFPVTGVKGEVIENAITIFANITLPGNGTDYNHIWQEGEVASDGSFSAHSFSDENLKSGGTIDFQSGASTGASNSVFRRRNTHGVLSAVSWGILMPIGVIMARYLKVFKSADPAWFYLHMTIQCSAYIIGVAGFGTGIKLGNDSTGTEQTKHRTLGIALFCFATLQVFALLLRPQKDHKYRIYWNFYHHTVGYAVIVLSIVNIFEGFEILSPEKKWKNAYIGIISSLGAIAFILEATTWTIVLKRRSSEQTRGQGV